MRDAVLEIYHRAVAQHPGVTLEASRFVSAWSRLANTEDAPSPECAADLYLATAAMERDPHALRLLQQRLLECLPQLKSFLLSSADEGALVNDALAALIGVTGAPRLGSYSARGPLASWLQVVLTRQVLALRRAQNEKVPAVQLDDVVLGSAAVEGIPELEVLKARFRGLFSRSFRAALQTLIPRQRNMLRQHYLDQLSLEELAMLYHVHRATIARHLADARAALLEATRDEVSRALGIGRLEVDSIVRLVASRLDISATFFLSQATNSSDAGPTS